MVVCHTMLHILWIASTFFSPMAFKISAVIPFAPGDFFVLKVLLLFPSLLALCWAPLMSMHHYPSGRSHYPSSYSSWQYLFYISIMPIKLLTCLFLIICSMRFDIFHKYYLYSIHIVFILFILDLCKPA